MFARKANNTNTIDSLIGTSTSIKGDVIFKGGLRIDGQIKGNINAESGQPSVLVISEHGKVTGEVRAAHLILNGEIVGDIHSSELLELQPKARITGNVFYKALEMHGGALVAGKLSYAQAEEASVLQLPISSEA
ncbi:cell shape determination protein CcmA [Herbaspirillum rubrisubalbicans]|uniref:bactofilin family protein n=1 Tax=Herbaspirillum rubrisubalbicans TaxID=80842 RepID=UPI000DC5C7FF|nr:polymer-forming cytoskeletal protein [Herbaspirillum rubrisubalbicans]RAN49515.1 cell shape determination protein CcmA [Herbaspirillum rubrisubalbicans]